MKKKQKILLIYAKNNDELLNRQAALGSYIHCLASLLEKKEFLLFINGTPFSEFKNKKTPALANNQVTSKLARVIPQFVKKPLKFIKQLRHISGLKRQLMEFSNYDIILEFYSCASDVGFLLSEKHKKKLFLVYDSPIEDEYIFFNGKSFFFKRLMRKREIESLKKANKIVVYSNPVKDYLNSKTRTELPSFIHQNVDFTRFEFFYGERESDEINIGFIGSFLSWHKVDFLLEAFIELKKNKKRVKLYLLGNGLEFNNIRQKIRNSEFSDDIVMPGFVDGNELTEFKKRIHIGVMPGSNWYGAPNKIFEYGAAGMAVVSTATPTITDLFGVEKDVLLFEPGNSIELYEKLLFLVENPMKLKEYGINLQKKIKNAYSESNTLNFYTNLISN